MIRIERVTALLLASGLSRRFGTDNKLIEPLAGKPLVSHAAGLVRGLSLGGRFAVVPPRDRAFRALIEGFGFGIVVNPRPADGRESSLRLGLARALHDEPEAILVLLGDMPHVGTDHILALAAAADSGRAAVSSDGRHSMPPLIVPAAIARDALARPEEPIRTALTDAVRVTAPAPMLRDYDLLADFVREGQGGAA
jgi:molybdenum cofactor cytidylyltransferase